MNFDRAKFKTLVHYICDRSADPQRLGAVKLNKILWFSDMFHFAETGTPLTGESYVKQQRGPVPRHVLETLRELQRDGSLAVREPEFGGACREFFSLKKPALDQFTAEQISLVDRLLSEICNNHTARSISEATHDALWEMAATGEEIPYEAFLAFNLRGDVDEDDVRWARAELADAAGH